MLLTPAGTPVYGSDDARQYFAQVDHVAEVTGTYQLKVTAFESVNTGDLLLTRR